MSGLLGRGRLVALPHGHGGSGEIVIVMFYRSNIASVLCPLLFLATVREMPARISSCVSSASVAYFPIGPRGLGLRYSTFPNDMCQSRRPKPALCVVR